MKVRWSNHALGQLTGIYEYVSRDSQQYAQRLVDRITARSQQIGTFPNAGQQVPEYGVPELREVLEGSYRIIYQVEVGQVTVLAVIHGGRLLPPLP